LIPTLSKLFSLSLRDVLVLVRAWCLFVYVDWVVSRWAYERWPTWMKRELVEQGGAEVQDCTYEQSDGPSRINALHVVRLSEIAARRHFRPMNCLRRSLVQLRLLQHFGYAVSLVLGVRKSHQSVAAHAWLCDAAGPLNDSLENIEGYERLKIAGGALPNTLR
jgi:hypothetical protein